MTRLALHLLRASPTRGAPPFFFAYPCYCLPHRRSCGGEDLKNGQHAVSIASFTRLSQLNNAAIGRVGSSYYNGDLVDVVIFDYYMDMVSVERLSTCLAPPRQTALPPPMLVLDAEAYSPTTDNTTWRDTSGNGRHFKVAGSHVRITYPGNNAKVMNFTYSTYDGYATCAKRQNAAGTAMEDVPFGTRTTVVVFTKIQPVVYYRRVLLQRADVSQPFETLLESEGEYDRTQPDYATFGYKTAGTYRYDSAGVKLQANFYANWNMLVLRLNKQKNNAAWWELLVNDGNVTRAQ